MELGHGPGLGELTGIHHDRSIAGLGDDRQVVGDEDDGQSQLPAERLHELQDLRLDHHVEGGGGLVADDSRGRQARAIAIITRWRIPPLNWWGKPQRLFPNAVPGISPGG